MSDTAPTETPVADPLTPAAAPAAATPSPAQAAAEDDLTFESSTDRKYPMCPEGAHKFIVKKAVFEMRDNFQRTAKVPTITLHCFTVDAKYMDAAKNEERPFRLFETLKVSDHAKSNMFEFFSKVCGIAVPLKEVPTAEGGTQKRIYLGPKTNVKVENEDDEIHYKQFEGLEFMASVIHKEKEDGSGVKDKIDTIIACSAEQKAFNAKLFTAA